MEGGVSHYLNLIVLHEAQSCERHCGSYSLVLMLIIITDETQLVGNIL